MNVLSVKVTFGVCTLCRIKYNSICYKVLMRNVTLKLSCNISKLYVNANETATH